MFGLDTDTIRNIKDCFAKIPQIQKESAFVWFIINELQRHHNIFL